MGKQRIASLMIPATGFSMKMDAKAIARLMLPAGKRDAIYFDREHTAAGEHAGTRTSGR